MFVDDNRKIKTNIMIKRHKYNTHEETCGKYFCFSCNLLENRAVNHENNREPALTRHLPFMKRKKIVLI